MTKPLLFLIITISLSLAACGNTNSNTEQPEVRQSASVEQVSSDQFEAMLERHPGAQLVDVRTVREFQSGHLENALNIDYYDPAFRSKLAGLKKDEPVFVYCAVGGRSASAAQVLKKEGFKKVVDLAGGIADWKRSGRKVK